MDRKQNDRPLVGYELYLKNSEDEGSKLVGRTDWQGLVTIPRIDGRPIQSLYVRNGRQLLGKLPIVAGHEALLVAKLRNDDLRLEAEGFLLGVQDSLVDLVARREVLATRIRQNIADGDLDEAEGLIKQLRRLDTQEDFSRRVQQRKSSLTSVDTTVQKKVDSLFADTRRLLGQYLNREQVERLASALREARSSSAAAGDSGNE